MESRFIGYKNFMTENALQYKRGWATDGNGSDMKFFKKKLFSHGTTALVGHSSAVSTFLQNWLSNVAFVIQHMPSMLKNDLLDFPS